MNPFNNTETAFKLRTNKELKKAKYLFLLIQKPFFTKIGSYLLNLLIRWKIPGVRKIIKNSLFKQFCGGENQRECIPVINAMYKQGVFSILDYSVERKEKESTFDHTVNETIEIINFSSKNPAMPFAVFKPTGLGRMALYEKVSLREKLTPEEEKEWTRVINRYHAIANLCQERKLPFMIDAEESWIQDAVDDVTTTLMQKFNKTQCIVMGTLQMYKTHRLDFLKSEYEKAKANNYILGFKIVRGAYMEKERERALQKGYPSPIQPTKEETDLQYNEALQYAIEHNDRIFLFAGTHNEKSCELLMELMRKNNLKPNSLNIWFGQLFGMSDNISFNLGHLGYKIAKYLPYGPVPDVIPYLVRRARENTSIAGQTGRELSCIQKELARRKG